MSFDERIQSNNVNLEYLVEVNLKMRPTMTLSSSGSYYLYETDFDGVVVDVSIYHVEAGALEYDETLSKVSSISDSVNSSYEHDRETKKLYLTVDATDKALYVVLTHKINISSKPVILRHSPSDVDSDDNYEVEWLPILRREISIENTYETLSVGITPSNIGLISIFNQEDVSVKLSTSFVKNCKINVFCFIDSTDNLKILETVSGDKALIWDDRIDIHIFNDNDLMLDEVGDPENISSDLLDETGESVLVEAFGKVSNVKGVKYRETSWGGHSTSGVFVIHRLENYMPSTSEHFNVLDKHLSYCGTLAAGARTSITPPSSVYSFYSTPFLVFINTSTYACEGWRSINTVSAGNFGFTSITLSGQCRVYISSISGAHKAIATSNNLLSSSFNYTIHYPRSLGSVTFSKLYCIVSANSGEITDNDTIVTQTVNGRKNRSFDLVPAALKSTSDDLTCSNFVTCIYDLLRRATKNKTAIEYDTTSFQDCYDFLDGSVGYNASFGCSVYSRDTYRDIINRICRNRGIRVFKHDSKWYALLINKNKTTADFTLTDDDFYEISFEINYDDLSSSVSLHRDVYSFKIYEDETVSFETSSKEDKYITSYDNDLVNLNKNTEIVTAQNYLSFISDKLGAIYSNFYATKKVFCNISGKWNLIDIKIGDTVTISREKIIGFKYESGVLREKKFQVVGKRIVGTDITLRLDDMNCMENISDSDLL